MDFQKKYKELIVNTVINNIDNEFPDCTSFDKIIIALRKQN